MKNKYDNVIFKNNKIVFKYKNVKVWLIVYLDKSNNFLYDCYASWSYKNKLGKTCWIAQLEKNLQQVKYELSNWIESFYISKANALIDEKQELASNCFDDINK